ncbi:hypothetical protein HMI56_006681 [Coelomomyces lativittatus]|nr:hypothetical protein HMI56_006681 [Coelomomyces lativittatus]
MEAQLEILLDSFSMVIPENSETLEGPKIRWGTHAEATAIACCILTARKYGKYISIGETSALLNVDPYVIGRHVSETTHTLFQRGHPGFQYTQSPHLYTLTQKWLRLFSSSPPETHGFPSCEWMDPKTLWTQVQKNVHVLLGIAESVFEGHLLDPTALSMVIIGFEVQLRRYVDVLPIALVSRMPPTTLIQRQRDWHYLFYRLSRQVPWSHEIRRTNFPCFLYQLLELVEHEVGLVDVGLPVSYMKSKKATDTMKERVVQVQRRLAQIQSTITPPTTLTSTSKENLDAAIESLLVLGEPPNYLAQLSVSELMAEYQAKCGTSTLQSRDLNQPTLSSLDLSVEEEEIYLNSMIALDETDKQFLEARHQVGLTINQWPI